jgi:hypothetical protein
MTWGGPFTAGLEQGVLALLGSKSSQTLLKVMPHSELMLACAGLVVALHAVPERLPLAGRVSGILGQVLSTIALNTLLASSTVQHDTALTCANLLSVYILTTVFLPHGALPETAQFLVVYNLSAALKGFQATGLAVAWAFAFVPHALPFIVKQDLVNLAQLVTVETWAVLLRAWLPTGLLLPTTLVLLYLCAPFVGAFPPLQRLYRFAVFAVSNDPQLQAAPPWIIASALWGLWQLEPDPVSKVLAANAGANLAVLTLLDALRFAMDNDPAPTLLALLVTIRIWEDLSSRASPPS